jgi:hypothetical protein
MMLASRGHSQASPGQQAAWGIFLIFFGLFFIFFRRRLWPIMVSRRFRRMNINEWGEGRGWFMYSFVLLPCFFVVFGVVMIVGAMRR